MLAPITDDGKYSWVSGNMMIPMPDSPELQSEAIGSAACDPAIEWLGVPAVQQSDASLGVSNLGGVRPGDNA